MQQSHLLIINRFERRCPFEYGKDYYIFKKICQGTLYEFSFLQGSIDHDFCFLFIFLFICFVSVPLFQWVRELPILDIVAGVIAFKLHVEGILGSQALSIALQG